MLSKKELLSSPNYLLTKYQNEIYRQLTTFMELNNLNQKDVAEKLGVSRSYINQILNGNFNFTLKKLIELGLLMDKVPSLQFESFDEFWFNEIDKSSKTPVISINLNLDITVVTIEPGPNISVPLSKGLFSKELIKDPEELVLNEFECYSN